MDIQELISWVTEGLDPEQAKSVRAAIERDSVKTKAQGLRKGEEVTELEARANRVAELEQELDALDPQGNPKGYRAWYKKYENAVMANANAVQKFEEKYGAGALQKALEGKLDFKAPDGSPAASAPIPKEEIQKLVDQRIQEQYGPQWSNLLTGTGSIVQKHMFAGRKNLIDFEAVGRLVKEKGMSLEAAYEEWDRPEREKTQKAQQDAEIERRVNEEIQKRGASANFPAGADFSSSPGVLARSGASENFDANALKRDLLKTFVEAGNVKPN